VASAVADSGEAVYRAVADLASDGFRPGVVRRIGLEEQTAVRLALAPDVSRRVERILARLEKAVVQGRIEVPTTYSGPSFAPPGLPAPSTG
jgi:basic membrane protein A